MVTLRSRKRTAEEDPAVHKPKGRGRRKSATTAEAETKTASKKASKKKAKEKPAPKRRGRSASEKKVENKAEANVEKKAHKTTNRKTDKKKVAATRTPTSSKRKGVAIARKTSEKKKDVEKRDRRPRITMTAMAPLSDQTTSLVDQLRAGKIEAEVAAKALLTQLDNMYETASMDPEAEVECSTLQKQLQFAIEFAQYVENSPLKLAKPTRSTGAKSTTRLQLKRNKRAKSSTKSSAKSSAKKSTKSSARSTKSSTKANSTKRASASYTKGKSKTQSKKKSAATKKTIFSKNRPFGKPAKRASNKVAGKKRGNAAASPLPSKKSKRSSPLDVFDFADPYGFSP